MHHLQEVTRSRPILAGEEGLARIARKMAFGVVSLLAAIPSVALAQDQIINHGQLAVTGYSGSVAVAPPEGADPFDYLRIRLDGPSGRVVEVRALGPQGQLSNATKPFTVTASQVGQVFGVTLDDAPRPNIYLAATSAYGLTISVIDQNGQPKRIRKGEPGAQWMQGQFGPPALGGGPGSIWKIDGTTGAVSLFANIQSAALGAASLGGLAYDPRTKQIFAVDRGTGFVSRFGLDGVQRGTYDHGTEGRGPAGLPTMPPTPVVPIDIGSPAFDTENPASWRFAAPARRVYAVAVRDDRLYYSIAQGPQVWSVAISPSGAVAADPRVEVEVPSLQDGIEIASIAFDGQGRMYLAERGATTGDYFRYDLANGGASRVLRYVRKPPGDPAPGLWRPTPDIYSIGLPPIHANAEGGVALGYGYNPDNVIDFNRCGTTMWSTGERLLDPGDPAAPPDSFPNIDGLQGNATNLFQPQNTPPIQSRFVDYDDLNGDANFRGQMGAVATLPCPAQPQVLPPPAPPPPPPPPVSCPPGTYFSNGQCIITPVCPPGTEFLDGFCVYEDCPPGLYLIDGQCRPPPVVCPPGTFYYQGQCFPIGCPPGLIKLPNGQCACPPGFVYYDGQCVPPQNCPPGMIELFGGICGCPPGTIFDDGFCKPYDCPPGEVWKNGFCQPCPGDQVVINGQCKPCPPGHKVENGVCVPICPPHLVYENGVCTPCPLGQVAVDGVCVDQPCPAGQEMWNDQCVPECPPDQFHQEPDGACEPLDEGIPPACPPGEVEWKEGECAPPCPPNQVHKEPDGACEPLDEVVAPVCPPGEVEWKEGECAPPCPPNQVHKEPDGACEPLDEVVAPGPPCPPGEEEWNGQCVPVCPPDQYHKPPDGACGPLELCVGENVEVWNGLCVDKCPPGQVHKMPDGACVTPPEVPDLPLTPVPDPFPVPPIGPQPPIGPKPPGPGPQPPVGPQPPGPVPPIGPRPPVVGPKLPDVIGPLIPIPPGPQPPAQEPPVRQPPVRPPVQVNPDLAPKLPEIITPSPTEPPTRTPPSPPPTTPPPSDPAPPATPPARRTPPAEIAPQTSTPPAQRTPPAEIPQTSTPPTRTTPEASTPPATAQPQVKTAPTRRTEPAPQAEPDDDATPQTAPPLLQNLQRLLTPQTR